MATIDDVVPAGHGGAAVLLYALSNADPADLQPLVVAMLSGWLQSLRGVEMPEQYAAPVIKALTTIREKTPPLPEAPPESRDGASVEVAQPRRLARSGQQAGRDGRPTTYRGASVYPSEVERNRARQTRVQANPSSRPSGNSDQE